MRRTSRRDDFSFMQGNGNGTATENGIETTQETVKKPSLSVYVPKNGLDKAAVLKEIQYIKTMVEKYDLQEQPEVLSGLLDEFKEAIKSGDRNQIVEFFKKPVVYGGIAAVLAIIILIKVSKKRRRK